MLLAKFYRGPFDGQHLVLPTEKPWPRFVIPQFGTVTLQFFYLYAGEEYDLHFYLYEEDIDAVTGADVVDAS